MARWARWKRCFVLIKQRLWIEGVCFWDCFCGLSALRYPERERTQLKFCFLRGDGELMAFGVGTGFIALLLCSSVLTAKQNALTRTAREHANLL